MKSPPSLEDLAVLKDELTILSSIAAPSTEEEALLDLAAQLDIDDGEEVRKLIAGAQASRTRSVSESAGTVVAQSFKARKSAPTKKQSLSSTCLALSIASPRGSRKKFDPTRNILPQLPALATELVVAQAKAMSAAASERSARRSRAMQERVEEARLKEALAKETRKQERALKELKQELKKAVQENVAAEAKAKKMAEERERQAKETQRKLAEREKKRIQEELAILMPEVARREAEERRLKRNQQEKLARLKEEERRRAIGRAKRERAEDLARQRTLEKLRKEEEKRLTAEKKQAIVREKVVRNQQELDSISEFLAAPSGKHRKSSLQRRTAVDLGTSAGDSRDDVVSLQSELTELKKQLEDKGLIREEDRWLVSL